MIKLIETGIILAAAIAIASRAEALMDSPVRSIFNETPGAVQDFSRFQHDNPMHARMPCLLCHKRDDDSATPRVSGHLPCAGCHVRQFADNGSRICTVCHTNTGAVKRFPGLRSFNVRFDHALHLREANCATCHKPSRRGVALSIPSGVGAHVACYQCHGPRTEVGGRNIGSCQTCHQRGRPTRNSDFAAAFAKNFSHAEHRTVGNLNCGSCHIVQAGRPRGRQVLSPAASMHFARSGVQSCATCHDNKRAFGGKDFSDCKRCHQGTSFKF
ncbi:MAG: hypothetical protein HOP17_08620 [Acidobacteria bacterium]|nr:hypothetical protein [Acidobacteriota bacterium]